MFLVPCHHFSLHIGNIRANDAATCEVKCNGDAPKRRRGYPFFIFTKFFVQKRITFKISSYLYTLKLTRRKNLRPQFLIETFGIFDN